MALTKKRVKRLLALDTLKKPPTTVNHNNHNLSITKNCPHNLAVMVLKNGSWEARKKVVKKAGRYKLKGSEEITKEVRIHANY